jgi:hypothetical protein
MYAYVMLVLLLFTFLCALISLFYTICFMHTVYRNINNTDSTLGPQINKLVYYGAFCKVLATALQWKKVYITIDRGPIARIRIKTNYLERQISIFGKNKF